MIFETHAHYDDESFDDDRDILLASLPEHGIGRVINVASSIESTKTTLALAEKYDFVYAAVGVHPSDVGGLNEETFAWLREQAMTGRESWTDAMGESAQVQADRANKVVAIGEIGLDYHWEKDSAARTAQQEWFVRQLDLAREAHLPVIIHSRDAVEDTMRILKEADGVTGVIHCYSYSPEMAREYVKMGYYIGIGGVVTFKNARKLKETVAAIPLERILLETDCPYMAPEPHRGERNDSTLIPYVVEKIAELRQMTAEEVEAATWENAERVFGRRESVC